MDIVCLGEVLIDMFPSELGLALADVPAFQPKPGGAPGNAAVAAQRLGAQAAFIGQVGDDAFGHHLIEVLKNEGVETRGMRVDTEARTTMAFIAKPDENTAEYVFYRNPGADTRLTVDELDTSLLEETKVFHFGSVSLSDEPVRSATLAAIQIAKEAGALVSYDVNYRPALWRSPDEAIQTAMDMIGQVDLLKVNEVELALLTGQEEIEITPEKLAEASQILLDKGPELVIVTLGPDGSFFQTANGSDYVPGFKAKTVDSVGCGDSFIAGLLTRLIAGGDWRAELTVEKMSQHLYFANGVGALTSQTKGVIPALPTTDQVKAFLSQQSQ
jgi:fructokinase